MFSDKTYIMGVLNVTPDSFSDGGLFFDRDKAVERALEMVREGASIVDVGGESTRPGAKEISLDEELSRVIPVIESISKEIDALISIDTRKAHVAAAATRAGASIINDVSGLKHDPDMAKVVARHGATVIVMHMKGTPQDMQHDPRYGDLISEIITSLRESIDIAKRAGVEEEKIIIDPGIGFGKTVAHNLEILNRLGEFKVLGHPICIGTSRKSFIGKVLNETDTDSRLSGTIATCTIAIAKGANIIRVHDVKEAHAAAVLSDRVLERKG